MEVRLWRPGQARERIWVIFSRQWRATELFQAAECGYQSWTLEGFVWWQSTTAGGGEKPEVGRTAPGIITAVRLRQHEERGRDGHGRRCRSRTNNTEGRRWGAKG